MRGLINRAERFVRLCHAGKFQKGKAQEPYTIHLEDVAAFLARKGGSKVAIRAA